jgi:hypothetical protein
MRSAGLVMPTSAIAQTKRRPRTRFRRTGDPAIGEFGDATLIRKVGDVPRV